jgi:predicted permease
MRDILQEFWYGCRQLSRARGFTLIAVLTLGLGVGVNTAFFAIANAITRQLVPPVKEDGVFVIKLTELQRGVSTTDSMSLGELRNIEKDPPPDIAAVAAADFREAATVTAPGWADQLRVEPVTGQFAQVFDLRAQAGRWLSVDDDRAGSGSCVAVISDRLWRQWFSARPAAPGTAVIRINRRAYTVVGVAEPQFRGVGIGLMAPEIWIPAASLPVLYPERSTGRLNARSLTVFVKGRTGAPSAELRTRVRPFIKAGWNGNLTIPVAVTVVPSHEVRSAPAAPLRLVMLGFSSLVLLAAAANLANMLYARGSQRQGELAVRMSLGASRFRIVRLLVVEALALGLLAGFIGFLVSTAATRGFVRAFPSFALDRSIRVSLDLAPDRQVFLYAIVISVAGAVLVGIVTALRAARSAPLRTITAAGTAHTTPAASRLRTSLVAVQVTAALILVMGAGLFLENPPRDMSLDKRLIFDPASIATAGIDLNLEGYDEARGRAFLDRLLAALSRMPGVEHAALADGVPGAVGRAAPPVVALIAEDSATRPTGNPRKIQASSAGVSAAFFDTLGVPVLRGRAFLSWETAGAPLTAMVTQSTAEALYPRDEALGKRVQYGFGGPWMTIVGVTADPIDGASDAGVFSRPANFIFVPAGQHYRPKITILLKSPAAGAQAEALRAAVRELDDQLPIFDAGTLQESLLAWLAPIRAANLLVATLGALALIIALLGVYGVINFFVTTRKREFGIRLALGATPRQVIRMVIDHTIHLLLVGLLFGVFVTTVSSRLIQNNIVRMMPNQLASWTAVPLIVLATGILAGYLPARRAARVDPNVALREL